MYNKTEETNDYDNFFCIVKSSVIVRFIVRNVNVQFIKQIKNNPVNRNICYRSHFKSMDDIASNQTWETDIFI